MGKAEKKRYRKNRYQRMKWLENKCMKKEISQLRKYLSTIKERKKKNLSLKQYMIDMVIKKVDEEIVTKVNIASFTRDHSTTLKSDNVENIGKIENFLMIEAELIKKKTIG